MTVHWHSVTVNGVEHRVEILERSAERVVFMLDGKRYEVSARAERPAPSAFASPAPQPRVFSGSKPAQQAPAAANGSIVAPMPGTVLNIFVREGETVAAGTPLLVLEAMKMENTVVAPRDGKVLRILVAAKNEVNSGQPLVELE